MVATHNQLILNQFEQYLGQIALSPKTVTNYLADLRCFARWLEEEKGETYHIIQVTPDQIRTYLAHLLEERAHATSTVNRHLQAIRKWCRYLNQTNLTPINAAEEIALVSEKKEQSPTIVSTTQADKLLAAAQKARTFMAKRDVAILTLLIKAGLRVREVVELQLEDVVFDFPGVHLNIVNQSGTDSRQIPLSAESCRTIKEWFDIRPKVQTVSHVFLSQEGKPISARTVQRIVNRCAKRCGLKGVTAQLLRRSYAMQLLQQTNNIELVQQRLGHQSQQVTLRYLQ